MQSPPSEEESVWDELYPGDLRNRLRATELAEIAVPPAFVCKNCIELQKKYDIEAAKRSEYADQVSELLVYRETDQQLKSDIEILKKSIKNYESQLQVQSDALKVCEDRYQQLQRDLDRDGDLHTACELANRRGDLMLQGNNSLSLCESAKRNGDARLITAVTTYNLLVAAQKHIDDGSVYSEFKRNLNLCKQTENDLSDSQGRIEFHVKKNLQEDNSAKPQPAIIAAEQDKVEAVGESYQCLQSGSDLEFNAEQELAVDGGTASAETQVVVVVAELDAAISQQEDSGHELDIIETSVLPHERHVVPDILSRSLDQMVNDRNMHRAALIQQVQGLCSQFLTIENLLEQRMKATAGLLCKLDGHLSDSPCSSACVRNDILGTQGTISKTDEVLTNMEHEPEQREEHFSKTTPELKQFAINDAILKVESWLSQVENLVSKAAQGREAAAAKFAGTLQTIVDLLSKEDLATITSLKEAAKLKPATGTHKYLEMAFLNETEVLKDKNLVLTFPFNECVCALCDAKSLLDNESADLIMFRPEVGKFIEVVKDLEPWVHKGPCEVMENLEQLNQEHLLLMHSRDKLAIEIKDLKRRGQNIDTLMADQQLLVDKNAYCCENLNVLVEEALRTTWHHFPENYTALKNLLQRIRLSLTENDSEQDVIFSNGLLKKKSIEMYCVEQSLVEIGARHRVLKCNLISNNGRATQSACVLKEFQTNISAYGTWACCQKSRTKWWKSFIREVGVLSRAQHPYIAQINCCFFDEMGDIPAAYIELPYYEGGTLSKWMGLNPSEHHKQRVLHQLLLGIEYLHNNGVIHCDIKPANILMKSSEVDSSPVLADFDVSMTFDKRFATSAGRGSFIYMAPELKQNGNKSNPVTSKAADIYSYGIVVFEICCPSDFQRRGVFEPPTTTLVNNRVLVSFLQELSKSNPLKRINATAALRHEYFTEQAILPNLNVASEFYQHREQFQKQLSALKDQLGKSFQAEKECSLKLTDKCDMYKSLKEYEQKLQELDGSKLTKANLAEREILDREQILLNLEFIKIKEDQEDCKEQIQIVNRQQNDFETGERNRENAELITTPPAHWKINTIKWMNSLLCKVDLTDEMKTNVEQFFQKSQELYPEFKGSEKYSVLSVKRLENPSLWKQYALQRHWIGQNTPKDFKGELMKYGPRAQWSETLMDKKSNEILLFHGTKQCNVNSIVGMGFDERAFELNGPFGAGIYFADSVDKSFQHCDKPASATNRSYFLFIARVVLGLPFVALAPRNKEYRAPPLPDQPSRFYNSVIAVTTETHPAAHLKTFREFVVYDRHQSYPELLVEFTRSQS